MFSTANVSCYTVLSLIQVQEEKEICPEYKFVTYRQRKCNCGLDLTKKHHSSGRPVGTTRAAGFKVSTGCPVGTTAYDGFNITTGRPIGSTLEAGYNVSQDIQWVP